MLGAVWAAVDGVGWSSCAATSPGHRRQRCSQLVAHIGRELILAPVGLLCHLASLQGGVQFFSQSLTSTASSSLPF